LICVVEDNDVVRSATMALVRSLGREARAFSCAEQYLASDPRPCPVCLIVDVHMPGMSGLEMQAELAASGDRTPIIFVTGFPDDHTRLQALARGAIAFLTKPFTNEALSRSIDRALLRSGPAGDTD